MIFAIYVSILHYCGGLLRSSLAFCVAGPPGKLNTGPKQVRVRAEVTQWLFCSLIAWHFSLILRYSGLSVCLSTMSERHSEWVTAQRSTWHLGQRHCRDTTVLLWAVYGVCVCVCVCVCVRVEYLPFWPSIISGILQPFRPVMSSWYTHLTRELNCFKLEVVKSHALVLRLCCGVF